MRPLATLTVVALALGLALSSSACCPKGTSRLAMPPAGPLSHLEWLAGTWRVEQDGKVTEEHWRKPRGGRMLGINQTTDQSTKDAKAVGFENLRIEARDDGVYYVATPEGGTSTEFKQTWHEPGEVGFENPAHDFPTRIVYRRSGTRLEAVIEGKDGKAQIWRFERIRD